MRLTTRLRLATTFVFMTLGSIAMLIVAALTGFVARRFYSEVMARGLGAGVLSIWGVRLRVHGAPQGERAQTIYISNHTSTIDLFALIALGLPRTRFFLSGFLKKLVPIGIVGSIIRVFWTVPQAYADERRKIFKRADRILRDTGDSVYLSPEGMRVTTGEVGRFNKGSFHLATSLRAPIVPIYVGIPSPMNPGMGYDAKSGTIDLYFLPPIDTSRWAIEDIERNRDAVRDLFVRVHDTMRTTGRLPASLSIESPARAECEEVFA